MKVIVQLLLLLFSLDQASSFKFTTSFTAQQNKQRRRFELNVINIPTDSLDTSTLTLDSFRDTSLSTSINFDDLQNLAVLLSVGLYFAYEKRPRGSANAELVEVKRSSVQSANLGLFCKSFIPQGTSLGFYPGVLGPAEFALKKKRNEKAQQAAKRYMWLVNDENGGTVLDPTNPDGVLSPKISYFFGVYEVNTLMARINEPPLGKDCNVVIKSFENSADLEIVAERDILGGEELFIDYGRSYDRSSYGSDTSDSDSMTDTTIDSVESRRIKERETLLKKEQLARRQEEIDMMTIQPISKRNRDLEFDPTGNNNNNKNAAFGRGNSNNNDDDDDFLDQDTTRPSDGFISNLRKQERESKNRNKNNPASGKNGGSSDKGSGSGIITPEEGMSLFNEVGPGMFSSTGLEDIEIMNELLGKKKKKNSKNNNVEEEDDSINNSSSSSSSDWLEVTDFRQMKKDKQNKAASKDEIDFVDSILNKSSPSSSSSSSTNNNNNSGGSSGSWNRNIDYNNEDPLAALRAKLLSQKADAKKQSSGSGGDEEDSGLAAEVNDEVESLLSELRSKSSSWSSSSATTSTTAGKGFGKKSTSTATTNTDIKATSDDDDFSFAEEFGVSKISFSDIFKTPLSKDDEDEDDFFSSSDALVRESIVKTSSKSSATNSKTNKIKVDTKNLDGKIAAGEIVDGSDDAKDDDDDDSNNGDDEEISVVVPKLTPEVEEDLTNKLEEMTDDEVKDIFRKIRLSLDTDRTIPPPPATVADTIANLQNPIPKQQSTAKINLFAAIKDQKLARQKQLQSEEAAEEFMKKYPKSKPVNPEIREKYKDELSKFEAELETLYKDPLSVWEELIKNPDIMKDLIPPSIANDNDS